MTKTYIRKDKKFYDIYSAIFSIIAVFIFTILVGIFNLSVQHEKLADEVKVSKITSMREVYQDDYTKALELDDVTVIKGEDIKVYLETSNYKLVSTYDSNGNFIEDNLEAKVSVLESILQILNALVYSYVIYWLLSIPGLIIKHFLGKKDDVLEDAFNKEQERLEKIRLKEKYPNLYKDLEINEE